MNCKRPIVSVAAFLSSQNAWFPDNLTSASYRGLNKDILKSCTLWLDQKKHETEPQPGRVPYDLACMCLNCKPVRVKPRVQKMSSLGQGE